MGVYSSVSIMMYSKLIALFGVVAASDPALEKTFSQCSLASTLMGYGGVFNSNTLGDWLCLTKYESSWNTAAVGGPNYDGSYDFGIFQINDYYWCSGSGSASKYNDCNISCSNLINSNISDDSQCATLIYNRHGFDAWYGWINHCKGHNNDHYASECGY